MKKQRPTIPISEWKLAVDLEATRSIQNQPGTPAHGCDCHWCKYWKTNYSDILGKSLRQQLERVGISLEFPTVIYEHDRDKGIASVRVVFHAVGKIIEGPSQWKEGEHGRMLMYQEIQGKPYISLVVLPQDQSIDTSSPVLTDNGSGTLVRIDFRMHLPCE